MRGEDGIAYMKFCYTSKKAAVLCLPIDRISLERDKKDGLRFENLNDGSCVYGKFSEETKRDMIIELSIELLKS